MICSPLWREIDQRTLVILDIISKMVDDWLYMADVKQKRWTMGLSYSSRRVRILFNQLYQQSIRLYLSKRSRQHLVAMLIPINIRNPHGLPRSRTEACQACRHRQGRDSIGCNLCI